MISLSQVTPTFNRKTRSSRIILTHEFTRTKHTNYTKLKYLKAELPTEHTEQPEEFNSSE